MKSRIFGAYIACLIFSLYSNICNAAIVTLDFDSVIAVRVGPEPVSAPYSEVGFVLSSEPGFSTIGTLSSIYTGSPALYGPSGGQSFILTKDGGGVFDAISIDFAELYANSSGFSLEFIGTESGSGTEVRQTFYQDGGAVDMETATFTGFSNLTSLRWNQGIAAGNAHQFDNIVLSDVSGLPVPAAFWLFGSGLLGLVGMAKHKKVQPT